MSGPGPATIHLRPATLYLLQQESFSYFLHETHFKGGWL
jgi:hypothetical protein